MVYVVYGIKVENGMEEFAVLAVFQSYADAVSYRPPPGYYCFISRMMVQ